MTIEKDQNLTYEEFKEKHLDPLQKMVNRTEEEVKISTKNNKKINESERLEIKIKAEFGKNLLKHAIAISPEIENKAYKDYVLGKFYTGELPDHVKQRIENTVIEMGKNLNKRFEYHLKQAYKEMMRNKEENLKQISEINKKFTQ